MGKKSDNKNKEKAYELKMARQRYLKFFLSSLFAAIVCLIAYSYLSFQGFFESSTATGFVVNAIFMVLAGVVGVFSYKWTKASRAFKDFIVNNRLSESDL